MLHAPSLARFSGLRHAFFTRGGGVSSGIYDSLNGGVGSNDDPGHVAQNRARMASALGVGADRFVTAYQVHSPDVAVADIPWAASERPKADAIVTRTPGLAIGVTTAHAGWRGALTGVLEATLEAMEKLGASRTDIVAALGPMIRQPNYEVGPEFLAAFIAADADNERFFQTGARADRHLFDLPGFIANRLRSAGLSSVEDIGLCTYAEPDRFYSYRRSQHRAEADYGRHISAIVIAG
jgi:copper oxidase (laccase) domain-containing protein